MPIKPHASKPSAQMTALYLGVLVLLGLIAGCQSEANNRRGNVNANLLAQHHLDKSLEAWNRVQVGQAARQFKIINGISETSEERRTLDAMIDSNLKLAIENAEYATAIDSGNYTAYEMLALCRYNRNEFARAIEDVERAYSLNPASSAVFVIRGHCRYKQALGELDNNNIPKAKGLIENAIVDLEEWCTRNPLQVIDLEKERRNIAKWENDLSRL